MKWYQQKSVISFLRRYIYIYIYLHKFTDNVNWHQPTSVTSSSLYTRISTQIYLDNDQFRCMPLRASLAGLIFESKVKGGNVLLWAILNFCDCYSNIWWDAHCNVYRHCSKFTWHSLNYLKKDGDILYTYIPFQKGIWLCFAKSDSSLGEGHINLIVCILLRLYIIYFILTFFQSIANSIDVFSFALPLR